ncbi:MAG TPA: DNA gyrase subunit A [Vicinamibacteria bacterium]|nr:DNA gyrase subunit A [Vicinamibacteria bacterium]
MATAAERLPVNIEDEMKRSYMDYAMSVIIGRALPDVRDGLKPVHRRVLYAMYREGLLSTRAYSKCAGIVGEVLKKYHPHGDAAVYDTLVRMAQDFNLRMPLIDGQGNFGSVDGDPPAAYRYTEARLTALAESMMRDIDKDTVDFVPNFDGNTLEPTVLPSVFPNLLVNGATGIAVGMATNIPPHNLREVIDGILHVLETKGRTDAELVDALLGIVRGPDFPTAAFVHGGRGIEQAYRTGRGSIQLRARATIEETGKDRESIVVTEIPYQVNKAKLVEKIGELWHDKKIEGISDLRDESDRTGMRIVIDLKRGEVAQVVLNNLYKHTALQTSFGIIMLAIVDNRPKVLSLLEMMRLFIDFRRDIVRRRTAFELKKAVERAHILEGFVIALDHLDEVIQLIRSSASPAAAREALMASYELSEIQAQAILDLQLQRLTAMERDKIVQEHREIRLRIEELKAILASEERIDQIVREELEEVKEKYGDNRRTEIIAKTQEISIEDMIAEEDMVITVSHSGYIKRSPVTVYRKQKRGGKGRIGMTTREEDFVDRLFIASTHSYILIFTDRGKVHWLKVHEIPNVGTAGKGKAIVNLVAMSSSEKLAAVCAVKEFPEDRYVLMATRNGVVKKTPLSAYGNPMSRGIIAIVIDDDDELIAASITEPGSEAVLATRDGKAIHFTETDARPMGRTARGVNGIRLKKGDSVVSMAVVEPDGTLLTVTDRGYGKRSRIEDYRLQTRGGQGVINVRTTERNGRVVAVPFVRDDDELMVITAQGMIMRLRVKDFAVHGRATQGVRLIELGEGDHVVAVAKLAEKDDEEGPTT